MPDRWSLTGSQISYLTLYLGSPWFDPGLVYSGVYGSVCSCVQSSLQPKAACFAASVLTSQLRTPWRRAAAGRPGVGSRCKLEGKPVLQKLVLRSRKEGHQEWARTTRAQTLRVVCHPWNMLGFFSRPCEQCLLVTTPLPPVLLSKGTAFLTSFISASG